MELWRELNEEGLATIQRFANEHVPETQTLEFKCAEGDAAPLTKGDLQNLGRSISAFANTDGGVLVWGVDSRPPRSDEDAVVIGLKPIAGVARFHADLLDKVGAIVTPPVSGLETVCLHEGDAGKGYVAVCVPSSRNAPHMSLAKDHHRYYLRSGASTLPMPHRQVEAMILAREGPILAIELNCRLRRNSKERKTLICVEAYVKNKGFGAAENLSIGVRRGLQNMPQYVVLPGPDRLAEPMREIVQVVGQDGELLDVVVHRLPAHTRVYGQSSLYALAFNVDVTTENGLDPAGTPTRNPIEFSVYCFSSRGSCEAHKRFEPGQLTVYDFEETSDTKIRRLPSR